MNLQTTEKIIHILVLFYLKKKYQQTSVIQSQRNDALLLH